MTTPGRIDEIRHEMEQDPELAQALRDTMLRSSPLGWRPRGRLRWRSIPTRGHRHPPTWIRSSHVNLEGASPFSDD